jgi:hypothetical protein
MTNTLEPSSTVPPGPSSTVPPITQNLTSAPDVHQDFAKLLDGVGLDPKDTGGEVSFAGADPILQSKHRLGAIMAMGMMGPAVATQIFYRMRGGQASETEMGSINRGHTGSRRWPTRHTRRCSVVVGTTTSMRPVSTS